MLISLIVTTLTSFTVPWFYGQDVIQSMNRMANPVRNPDATQNVETSGTQFQIVVIPVFFYDKLL